MEEEAAGDVRPENLGRRALGNRNKFPAIRAGVIDCRKRNPGQGFWQGPGKSLIILSPEWTYHWLNLPGAQQGVHQNEQHDRPSKDK